MGRTVETYRVRLEKEISVWKRYLKSCSPKRIQTLFDSAFTRAHWYADACSYWSNSLIQEKMIFSVLFSQYREILSNLSIEE